MRIGCVAVANLTREQVDHVANLLTQPGWLLFKDYVRDQWGPAGYGRRLKLAVTSSELSQMASAVLAIDMANNEINAIMTWPEDQVKAAAPKPAPEFSLQRGGA